MPTTLHPLTESDHVRRYTSPKMLLRVEEEIERNVACYAGRPDEVIGQRIEELRQEWSINRYLQANVAAVGLLGAVLGLTVNRKFALLTAIVFGTFLVHGVGGWDPRIQTMRKMGIRTRSEIDREIYALKVMRGDFKDVPADQGARNLLPIREIMRAVNS